MYRTGSTCVLNTSVLVLNRHYMAIHVVTARRAFILLYRELAEVIHFEEGRYANYDFASWCEISEFRSDEKQPDEDWIRTVNFQIQVPRVIRLYSYDRLPRRSLRLNRRNVLARDNHCCQYCGASLPSSKLSVDHVVPRSRGGRSDWENVVCACLDCNTRKGGRTPQEARMRLIRKPTRPKYSPLLAAKLANPKFACWKSFLPGNHAMAEMS